MLLLDTHVLLWLDSGAPMTRESVAAIDDAAARGGVLVSPVSALSDETRSALRPAMTHAFPYTFESEESGGVLVQFVDVPEAHTSGASEAAAGEQALDCLIAALGGYIKLARQIPRPSPARGRPGATWTPPKTWARGA